MRWRVEIEKDWLVQVSWSSDGRRWKQVRVLVEREPDGHLAIAELTVERPTPTSLRALRLGAIETQLNVHRDEILRAQGIVSGGIVHGGTAATTIHHGPRLKLRRPPGRHLDDSFYERVANCYRDAYNRGLNPQTTLADDSGAPPETVRAWVRLARKKGKLGPARPGKAGDLPARKEFRDAS